MFERAPGRPGLDDNLVSEEPMRVRALGEVPVLANLSVYDQIDEWRGRILEAVARSGPRAVDDLPRRWPMTRQVNRILAEDLISAGLLERVQDVDSGRHLVRLTAEGREFVARRGEPLLHRVPERLFDDRRVKPRPGLVGVPDQATVDAGWSGPGGSVRARGGAALFPTAGKDTELRAGPFPLSWSSRGVQTSPSMLF